MRILLLGDICGNAGMKIIKLKLKEIIKEKKLILQLQMVKMQQKMEKELQKKILKI